MTIEEFIERSKFPGRTRTRVLNFMLNTGATTLDEFLAIERRLALGDPSVPAYRRYRGGIGRGAGAKTIRALDAALLALGKRWR